MSLSRDEVLHVARLARLKLTDEEVGQYQEKLGKILDHIRDLEKVDLSGIVPTSHAVDLGTPFREDVAVPFGDREALLRNAPDRSGDFFRVPRIIED